MKRVNLFVAVLILLGIAFTATPMTVSAKTATEDLLSSQGQAKATEIVASAIDINSADQKMLTTLPGVGPVTAEAIISYRQKNGAFKSLEELTAVKGIGSKTLLKMKPYLKKI